MIMQLKYPFFDDGISESDFCDIDFVTSRGAATNGVKAILVLDRYSAVPAKVFARSCACAIT